MMRTTILHRARVGILAAALVCAAAGTAEAQLDPLQFIKRVPPTVVIAVDTSMRMLDDGSGNVYDPIFYKVSDDAAAASALGINTATVKTYRRRYDGFAIDATQDATHKYLATRITAVPAVWDPAVAATSNNAADIAFTAPTRLEIARAGIIGAVAENSSAAFRWGLVKARQTGEAWRSSPNCDKPLNVSDAVQLLGKDASPCNAGALGSYGVYLPSVTAANGSNTASPGDSVMVAAGGNKAAAVLTAVKRKYYDSLGLIPASLDTSTYADRPLAHLLTDAKAQVVAAMTADSAANRSCRNSVVVLITGGKDDGSATYKASYDAATVASSFSAVAASGTTRRVPIIVIAVKPLAADEASLQQIATNSGGRYFKVTDAAGVQRAIDYGVALGFGRAVEVDARQESEYQPVSPIVGTVNLKNARGANGSALAYTDITASPGGQHLPQRSNMILASGFATPSFEGRIRAFRTYVPAPDATKSTGWKFVNAGIPLWPDLEGDRPEVAGMARTPGNPDSRNIYTWIPDATGSGGTVIPFNMDNSTAIAPYLGGASAATVIPFVRRQPLGAVIGSTPAIMDPPSLDPPPDDDYGRSEAADTFAGDHKDRRSIIWVGANDGMIHGIDARTGYEVWAFIPFNLLPKLQTLLDGQPVDQFDYFVDSSPKIAEVKIDGAWKSLLLIGQANGGTFYQAFDVSEAGMGGPPPDSDDIAAVLASFSTTTRVPFLWSWPRYSQFDTTYFRVFSVDDPTLIDMNVIDATPSGKVKMYGDFKSTATRAEKTVGYTWSDPAVGPLNETRTVNAAIVGSGYFPAIEEQLPGRGGAGAPIAGRILYLLDLKTGQPLGGATSCGSTSGSSGCVDIGIIDNLRKNAIQADPTAASDAPGQVAVKRAYVGDIDGRYWRFRFTDAGAITFTALVSTGQPIYNSSALLFVGTTEVYMFFATGSDLLPPQTEAATGNYKIYGLKDNYPAAGATTKFAINLAAVSNVNGLVSGERPSAAPTIAGDVVFFTTTTESGAAPCADYTANLYALTFSGGAAYDTNGNGRIDTTESSLVRSVAGRASAPFIVDQHLYFGTAGVTGSNVEVFGDPEDFNNGIGQVGVRILSWREIR